MLLNIFETEQTYYDEYEIFCLRNCLRQLLEYYKVDDAALFINTSLSNIVTLDSGYQFGYKISYDKGTNSVLPSLQKKVRLNYGLQDGFENIWEQDKLNIINGNPIIVNVDPYYLEYQQQQYYRTHNKRSVILCGCSSDEKKIYLIDWYAPWFFKGQINIEQYIMARGSENPFSENCLFSGDPINNFWVETDCDGWNRKSEELLHETISLTIKQYFNSCNDSTTVFNGVNGLKKISDILLTYADSPIDDRNTLLKELHLSLLLVNRRKTLFKFYIESALKKVDNEILKEVSLLFASIVQKWSNFIPWITKANISSTNESYIKVISKLNDIISSEEHLYDFLEKLNSSLSK